MRSENGKNSKRSPKGANWRTNAKRIRRKKQHRMVEKQDQTRTLARRAPLTHWQGGWYNWSYSARSIAPFQGMQAAEKLWSWGQLLKNPFSQLVVIAHDLNVGVEQSQDIFDLVDDLADDAVRHADFTSIHMHDNAFPLVHDHLDPQSVLLELVREVHLVAVGLDEGSLGGLVEQELFGKIIVLIKPVRLCLLDGAVVEAVLVVLMDQEPIGSRTDQPVEVGIQLGLDLCRQGDGERMRRVCKPKFNTRLWRLCKGACVGL